MATIRPQGVFHLLKGVPLTIGYEHTLYFNGLPDQQRYFLGKAFRTFDKLSYINDNTVKLEIPADEIRECNYCMFRNIGFDGKWFYAFITGVRRISNTVTAVSYMIDVMQTWFLFDTVVKPCYIDRMHIDRDYIGANDVDEGLETGEQTADLIDMIGSASDIAYLVGVTQYVDGNGNWVNATGGVYSGLFSGIKYFAPRSPADAARFITNYNNSGRGEAIVSVTIIPRWLVTYTGVLDNEVQITVGANAIDKEYARINNLNGYLPYNRKVLQYPYVYFNAVNFSGNALTLKQEKFNGDKIKLVATGSLSASPQIAVFPSDYLNGGNTNYLQMLTTPIYSQVAFTTDNYRAWLAQTASSRAVQASLADYTARIAESSAAATNQKALSEWNLQHTENVLRYADATQQLANFNLTGAAITTEKALLTNYERLDITEQSGILEMNAAALTKANAETGIRALAAQVADHSVIPPSAKGSAITTRYKLSA